MKTKEALHNKKYGELVSYFLQQLNCCMCSIASPDSTDNNVVRLQFLGVIISTLNFSTVALPRFYRHNVSLQLSKLNLLIKVVET